MATTANQKSDAASQELQQLGQHGRRRASEGGNGHSTNPADLSLRQSLPRRPSLDWPNLNNQRGFKPMDQEHRPPDLELPDATKNVLQQTLEGAHQMSADNKAKLDAGSTLDASAPQPLSLLKKEGSAHSSAASMHSAASGASTSGLEMPPLMPGRLNSQEMNIEGQKDDVFLMPMETPGGGPTASEMSPSAPPRIRRIAAQSAAPAAHQAQDACRGGSKLPRPGAGAGKAAEPNNVQSPHGQKRLLARNAPSGSSPGEPGGAYTSLQVAANKALAQKEPAGGSKIADSKLARAREYARSLAARGTAASARSHTNKQSRATSIAQSVASSHPGSGTVSPRHPGTYGTTHGATNTAGYSASPRAAPHQPNTGAPMGSAASIGAGSGRYTQQPQRGYAQQQGGGGYAAQHGSAQQQGGVGGYAQRGYAQQHGYSAVPGSPGSVGSGGYSAALHRGGAQPGNGVGGYSGALQRGGVQSGSGVSGYSGVQRAGSHLAPPKVGGVVRPSGIGMGASKRPGYGAASSGPGVVPGATGSPRIGPTHATTTNTSSANSNSIPAAPRTDAQRQTSIPRLKIPGPSSSSHSRTSSFNTCGDPSSATAAAAATVAVSAPASAPIAAANDSDAASAPYADSAVGDLGPDHTSHSVSLTPQGTPQAPSEPDHPPQPQPQPAGAAVVGVEGVEGEAGSKADAAAAPLATPTILSASGSTSARMHKGSSLIPSPPTTNQAGGGLGSGVGSATPRHLQRSNTLATRGGSVAGLHAHPDLLLAIKDRDWEIQGLQTELAKTAAALESVYVDLENEAKERAEAQAKATELDSQLQRVQEQQKKLQEACTAAYEARDAAERQQHELQDMCEEALGVRDQALREVARMRASLEAIVPGTTASGGGGDDSNAEAQATGDAALQEELQRCIACLADAGAGDSPTSNSHLDVQGQLKQLRESLQGALRSPTAAAAAAAAATVPAPVSAATAAGPPAAAAGVPAAASSGEGGGLLADGAEEAKEGGGGVPGNVEMEEHIKALEADKSSLANELAASRAAAADVEAQRQQHALELQEMQRQLDTALAAVKNGPHGDDEAVSMVSTDAGSTPQQPQANCQTFITAAVQTDHDEKPIGGPQEKSTPEGAGHQRSLSADTSCQGTQSNARELRNIRSVSTLLPAERAKRLAAISLESHPEQLAEWEGLVKRSSEAGTGTSPKKWGVPHTASQLRGALGDLHAHVQQQLQGLGGQDSRMAALLQQLGEQEAEQQMVLGAVHRELQARIKQATAEASAMAANSPRGNQGSANIIASGDANSAAPPAQNTTAAEHQECQAEHPAGEREEDAAADTADAAATVREAPMESVDKHVKEGGEAGLDWDLAKRKSKDPGLVARLDEDRFQAGLGDEEGKHGSEDHHQQQQQQLQHQVNHEGVVDEEGEHGSEDQQQQQQQQQQKLNHEVVVDAEGEHGCGDQQQQQQQQKLNHEVVVDAEGEHGCGDQQQQQQQQQVNEGGMGDGECGLGSGDQKQQQQQQQQQQIMMVNQEGVGDEDGGHGSGDQQQQQQVNQEDSGEGPSGGGVKESGIEGAGVDGKGLRAVAEVNDKNDDGGASTVVEVGNKNDDGGAQAIAEGGNKNDDGGAQKGLEPRANGRRPPKSRQRVRNTLISVGCTTVAGGASAAILLTRPEAAAAAAAAVRTYASHTGRALAQTGGGTRNVLGRASNAISKGVSNRWSHMGSEQEPAPVPTLPTSLPRPAFTRPWWDVR